ncbi:MAG: molybdate ABC transporter permease subunit [Eubacteriales bacterium]|nr:molybdate ABC transporter permease subunit [Eubacteriales bacterium]
MDLYPLYNSIRISLISMAIVLIVGIFAAYYVSKAPKYFKAICDVIFTLPLVLPPTVVGYFLLKIFGPNHFIGELFINLFDIRLTMVWWSAVFATTVVVFPLMYRTARGAFQSFNNTLSDTAMTLGLSRTYIFWKIRMPYCRQGIIAGAVLSFARALGEYGATSMIAGYIPNKTATISTTVYQLWRIGDDELAFKWVMINVALSAVVLFVINIIESKYQRKEVKYVSLS